MTGPEELALHGDRMVPEGHLDFAVNVVDGGPPGWLRERLIASFGSLRRYPDDADAVREIAQVHGRRPDEVLPLNGSAEAFWLVAALRPQRAVVVHPTFAEPEVALRAHGSRVRRPLRDPVDFSFDPRDVPEDADVVAIGRPNNPTGNLDPGHVIERLARPGRLTLVDEAFIEFAIEERSLTGRPDLPGLLVLRSLTKLWAVPGLRAGYLVGPAPVVRDLAARRQPWSVNSLALSALVACAQRPPEASVARAVVERRERLFDLIRRIPGVSVWPSEANFLLLHVPDGAAVRERLAERRIAVRPCHTFPGLTPDHLRVAVRSTEDNALLVEALRAAIET